MLLRINATTFEKAVPLTLINNTQAIVASCSGTYMVNVEQESPLIVGNPVSVPDTDINVAFVGLGESLSLYTDYDVNEVATLFSSESVPSVEERRMLARDIPLTVNNYDDFETVTYHWLGEAIDVTYVNHTKEVYRISKKDTPVMYFNNITKTDMFVKETPFVLPVTIKLVDVHSFPYIVLKGLIALMQ